MWPSKSLEHKIPMKHNGIKNPNWWEENQLGSYKGGWGFWTWDCREKIQLAVRVGLELGASELQVQCSNHPVMWHPQFTWAVALGGRIRWQGVGWEEASSQPLSLGALETKMATRWTYRKIGDCKQSMICSLSNNNNCFFRLIINLKKSIVLKGCQRKGPYVCLGSRGLDLTWDHQQRETYEVLVFSTFNFVAKTIKVMGSRYTR